MGRFEALLRRSGNLGSGRPADRPLGPILGSIAVSGAQVAVGGFYALASLYLVRTLSTHEYGRVAFGIYAYTLIFSIANLGLSTGVMAEVARGRHSAGSVWAAVDALLGVRLLSILPVLGVGLTWAVLSGDVIPAMASIIASTAIASEFLIGVLAGSLRIVPYLVVILSQPILFLVLLLGLEISTAEPGLVGLGVALATSLLLAVAFIGRGSRRLGETRRATLQELRHALTVARDAYALNVMHIAFVSLPIVLLGELDRFADAAALSIVMTLVRFAPEALGLAVVATYLPRVKASGSDSPAARALFATYARVLGLVAIPAAIGLAVLGKPLLSLLFAGRYDALAPMLAVGSVVAVLLVAESLAAWTLVADGKGRVAIFGLATRLVAALVSCVVIVAAPDQPAVLTVLVASATGSLLSAALLLVRLHLRRGLSLPYRRFIVYAVLVAAAYGLTSRVLAETAPDPVVVVVALAITAPLLGLGIWLTRPGGRPLARVA